MNKIPIPENLSRCKCPNKNFSKLGVYALTGQISMSSIFSPPTSVLNRMWGRRRENCIDFREAEAFYGFYFYSFVGISLDIYFAK